MVKTPATQLTVKNRKRILPKNDEISHYFFEHPNVSFQIAVSFTPFV